MRANSKGQGQWNVQLDKNDCNQLGDVKLYRHRSNLFIASFNALIDVCCERYGEEFYNEWKDCCNKFVGVMEAMDSRIEFGPEDIDEFQLIADEF